MGYWTDIILSFASLEQDEDERIAEVNTFFVSEHARQFDVPLARIDNVGKEVYAGTYKSFNLDAFLKHVNAIKWEEPEHVQVFIKLDDDQQFKLAHGVQAYDSRFEDRDRLLSDAEYLVEMLRDDTLSEVMKQDASEWLAEYKKFKEEKRASLQ